MDGEFSDDDWDDDLNSELARVDDLIQSQQQSQQRSVGHDKNENAWSGNGVAGRQTGSLNLRKVAAGNLQYGPGQRARGINATESFDSPSLDEDGVPDIVESHDVRRQQPTKPIDETTAREEWRQGRYAQKHGPAPQIPQQHNAQVNSTNLNGVQKNPYTQNVMRYPGRGQRAVQPPQQQGQVISGRQPITNARATNTSPQVQPLNGADRSAVNDPDRPPGQTPSEALRIERERWQAEKKALEFQLLTARGEASLVRKRTESELKQAERQTELLKKQIQEENQKHQATILSRDEKVRELATSNKFLQHEVDDQSRKIRSIQQSRDRPLQERSSVMNQSPRKNLTSNLRDGFDDDVIMHMSPARSPAKRRVSKPSTPTKKRKHPAADDDHSHALSLRLSGEPGIQPQDEAPVAHPVSTETIVSKDYKSEQHLEVLQAVMAHRPDTNGPMVLESLVQFTLPSKSEQTLSTLLLGEIAKLKGEHLPRDLLLVFMRLLGRCVTENYYKPTNVLMSCVMAVMDADPTFIDKEAIEGSLPTLQSLVRVNAQRRYLLSDRLKVWNQENPKPKEDADVSTYDALEIMFTMASLIVDEPHLLNIFWRWADTGTILVMLHSSQRLEDIKITLDLLATSIFPTTFGLITTPPENTVLQARTIDYVVDKIVFLLWDPPRRHIRSRHDIVISETPIRDRMKKKLIRQPEPEPEPDLTREEICSLRLKALDTLMKFGYTSIPHPHHLNVKSHHGTTTFLNHVNALARLVRLLHDEVYELCQNHPTTHHLHAELVNRVIVLIHHVLLSPEATAPDSDFDLTKCLSGSLMGSSKFRVVMTKLALARDASIDIPPNQGLDAGVTEHTRDLARDILGQYITPDEATQLTAAFGVMDVEDDGMETEEPDIIEIDR